MSPPVHSEIATPNVAVAGGGRWGRNWIRNMYELGALRWIVDTDAAVLAEHEQTYPGVRTTTELREALADVAVRGVVLATPAVLHAEQAELCIRAGRDVLCEKPLALSVAEALPVAALARATGRVLMVGHVLRYHPGVAEAIRLVRSGLVGRVNYVSAHRLGWGKIRTVENVLYSFSPHDFSFILAIAGELPREVNAGGAAFVQPRIHDIVTTRLSFSSFDAHVYASWIHPYREQRMVVIGDRGMLIFDDLAASKLTFHRKTVTFEQGQPVTHQGDAEVMPYDTTLEPLKEQARAFLHALATGQPGVADVEEGLAVLRVLEAAQRSLDTGGTPVPVTEALAPAASAAPQPASGWAHPTAVVDEGALLGAGTKIWHFGHISSGAQIGRDCSFGQNAFVAPGVVVGNNVKVQNNVSLYTGVVIEDDVFLGPSCVLTNVTNPRSHVSRRNEYKTTLLRRGCSIGANATIVCGTEIGAYAFVAAGAVVTRNVPPYAQVMGSPARPLAWRCQCGERLADYRLPVGTPLSCTACESTYRLVAQDRLVPEGSVDRA